ncbi:MAG: hypothetical protein WA691_00860 [Thermoplasmata archaeon]
MSTATSTATPSSALPPASAPPSRAGAVRDSGTVRRDSLRAATWTSTGLVKVQGDVDVGSGSTSGLVSVGGKLSAGSFRARGTLEVLGPTNVRDQLTLEGTVHLQAAVHAGAVEAKGTFRSPSDVRVDRALSVTGTFEAPSAHVGLFDLTGSAEISGDLEAAVLVRGRFRGNSHLGTIRARSVVLEGPPTALIPTLWRRVFGGSATVEVGRIEADSVSLRAVDVEFVRSPEIVLGPGAHVTTVEGTIVRRHPTSRVGPESRSPRPHGLSR